MTVALCVVVTVAAVAYAAGKAKAVPVAEVVRARRFEVVDAAGKVRAKLETTPEGESELWLGCAGPYQSIHLVLLPDNLPLVSLSGPEGTGGIMLDLTEESPRVTLWHKDGKASASLAVSSNGCPALTLTDSSAKPRAQLGLSADGSPAVQLFDKHEKVVWRAP
jgi:hypothetical protein